MVFDAIFSLAMLVILQGHLHIWPDVILFKGGYDIATAMILLVPGRISGNFFMG